MRLTIAEALYEIEIGSYVRHERWKDDIFIYMRRSDRSIIYCYGDVFDIEYHWKNTPNGWRIY